MQERERAHSAAPPSGRWRRLCETARATPESRLNALRLGDAHASIGSHRHVASTPLRNGRSRDARQQPQGCPLGGIAERSRLDARAVASGIRSASTTSETTRSADAARLLWPLRRRARVGERARSAQHWCATRLSILAHRSDGPTFDAKAFFDQISSQSLPDLLKRENDLLRGAQLFGAASLIPQTSESSIPNVKPLCTITITSSSTPATLFARCVRATGRPPRRH